MKEKVEEHLGAKESAEEKAKAGPGKKICGFRRDSCRLQVQMTGHQNKNEFGIFISTLWRDLH